VFLLAALVTGAPAVAAAAPPGGGTVSGTVTRADTAAPVAGVDVQLIGEDEYAPATTDADGRFRLEGVPAGDYRLRFEPPAGSDLAATFWRGAAGWEESDVVRVADGATVAADMVLPVGATLSGTVTRARDGAPVPGVTAWIDGDGGSTSAVTDADGRYRAAGLNAGTYIVEFSPPIVDDLPPELAHEYYRGVRSPDLATPVVVAAGANVEGIDAALEDTGSISGRVVRADSGDPISGAMVHFQPEDYTMGFSTRTAADGTYTLAGVVPGRHFVEFSTDDEDLLDAFWPDAVDWEGAEPVAVEAGVDTPGIDAVLASAAVIAGEVRFGGTAWTAGGTVTLEPVAAPDAGVSHPLADDGTFRIGKLLPGEYFVSVQPTADDSRAASQYHPGAPTRAAAQPVALTGGALRAGIDFDLVRGVDITGTVSSEGELALPADIVAYRWSGTAWEEAGRTASWDAYSFAHPPGDVAGHYLPPGRYTIGFVAEGRCSQFWDGVPALADAASFELAAGDVERGIDATLRAECPAVVTPSETPAPTATPSPSATAVDRLPEAGGSLPAGLLTIGVVLLVAGSAGVAARSAARRSAG
jgi:hypothetical protein